MRRAWIEIPLTIYRRFGDVSPSVRRAWIEIYLRRAANGLIYVTLREEGVD